MPLSEEELRLLEQMERALVAEDPKFASTLRGTALRRSARRRSYIAGVVFLAGVAVLMTGAITRHTIVGIIGFVVMLVSAYVALSSWRSQNQAPRPGEPADNAPGARGGHGLSVIDGGKGRKRRRNRGRQQQHSMMDRLEERWRRRREQNGGF